jgi:ABC-type dipeptide/oligopeptide/nickel transport system permease subunit
MEAATPSPERPSTLRAVWRRFVRRPVSVVALFLILAQIVVAILAPLIAPHDPLHGDYAHTWEKPGRLFLLGTDDLGRDVLTRIIYGARMSLSVGILSQFIAAAIGLPLGALAAMAGRWVDYLIMRVIDVLSSLPALLFYIILMIVLGAGFWNIILAMSITGWVGYARLVRGQVLSLKQTDYVRAARSMGAGTRYITVKHLLRNAISPVIVSFTLGIPGAMFSEAGLSLLGIGIAPPTPSWGQMIGQYMNYIYTAPYLTLVPALVLAFSMLCWILIGDNLRDAMDPTVRM